MGDYDHCICGKMIRLRTWHDRLQWVHVESGTPWCIVQRAEPAARSSD